MLGMLAGWFTGRWDMAMPLAVFVELFWLDVIRLGAIVPPSGALSFLLLFSSVLLLDVQAPAQLPLPLLLCVPCAYVASLLERYSRERANASIEPVAVWCAGGGGLSPRQVIARGLLLQAGYNALLFLTCFVVIIGTLFFVQRWMGLPSAPELSWNILYGLGLMGAVLALRTRRAYAVLCCAVLLILFVHLS